MPKNRLKKPADQSRRRSAAPSDTDGAADDFEHDELDLQPIEVKRQPLDQVKGLTEADLGESFTRSIGASDPNMPQATSVFNYEEQEYKNKACTDYLKVHFFMEGVLIDAESVEARDQAERLERLEAGAVETADVGTATEGEGDEQPADTGKDSGVKIKNQFNFSERATQTFNNPQRNKLMVTEPAPTCQLVEQVSAHNIFDTYLADIERKILAASLDQQKKKKKKSGEEDTEDDGKEETVEVFDSPDFARAMKMMERMINNNSEAEDFNYFKYYEDKNESKREDGRGSFLALWRFGYEPAVGKNVTSICWNHKHIDLFAVGFGSYDFVKQGNGMICAYTLKNTTFPEFVVETESGVMCLDFNPKHPALLCAGMYDGSVAVYDMRTEKLVPIYASDSPASKHTDPVWQVYWDNEKEGEPLSFFSISSDGRVIKWQLAKTELTKDVLVTLKLYQDDVEEQTMDSAILGYAGGSCFDFNKNNEHLFVVGTEEGAIQLYSKQYNTKFLRKFEGHHMAIYSVKWNTYHPNVFLSCSADWTVKLWEVNTNKPIMVFDLNTSVGDVAWSPFSSTVFATITSEGKVRVYDLAVNKHEEIGEYKVPYRGAKKNKLTKISFNPVDPILCVGDDRGYVRTLKLSNNLRKMSAQTLEEIDREAEIAKLDKVMIMPDDNTEDDVNALLEAAAKGNTNVGA